MKDIRIIFKRDLKALIKEEDYTNMNIIIRKYTEEDLPQMIQIWNEVVEDGIAFPQEDLLTADTGKVFFASQTFSAIAEDVDTGKVYGLYILHPNNVGRCSHICNASYAVRQDARGLHIGKNWCRIAWCKERHTVLASCNLMRSLLRTFMPGICMNGWDLCSLA